MVAPVPKEGSAPGRGSNRRSPDSFSLDAKLSDNRDPVRLSQHFKSQDLGSKRRVLETQ